MAKRKRKSTTYNKAKRTRKNNSQMNLKIVGTIVFSILLAVLLYTNSGAVGKNLNQVLGGLMGILRYILPIGTFAIAIKMASQNEEDYIANKLVQYTILLICIAIIMSIYEISKGSLDVTSDMSQNLKRAYALGAANQGGGAIGTLAAIFLSSLLGNLGAVVLSVGVSLMLLAFVCGIDISGFISKRIENHIERKEENKLEKEERRLQREEYLAKQREELRSMRLQKQLENQGNGKKMPNKEIAAIQEAQGQKIEPEQIKINLNGRLIEDEEKGPMKGLKKLIKKQPKEEEPHIAEVANDIMNIDKETGEILENDSSLFVQEEEQKQDKTKQVLQLEHTMAIEEDNYVFPPVSILNELEKASLKGGTRSLTDTAAKLQKTLYSFGVQAKVENVTVGPAITRYELKPAEGVRVSKIANLADDIALNLAAETIRIEAPIPGKQAVRN